MGIDDGIVKGRKPTALSRRRFLGTAGVLVGSSWLAALPACSGGKRRTSTRRGERRWNVVVG